MPDLCCGRAASARLRSRSGTIARVRVVLVNHNTSMYAELALRSLLALNDDVDFDITSVALQVEQPPTSSVADFVTVRKPHMYVLTDCDGYRPSRR